METLSFEINEEELPTVILEKLKLEQRNRFQLNFDIFGIPSKRCDNVNKSENWEKTVFYKKWLSHEMLL